MEKVIINGETLCYRKAGSGDKVLLLIHGNMSSSVHWQPVMEALPDGYMAIAPDLRGFGDSTYNTPVDGLEDFADDLVKLTQELGISKCVPVGWSTGGGVAMLMAAQHPQLVEKVVLLESVGYTGYPIFKKDESGQPIIGEHYANREEMAKDPVQVAPILAALEQGNSAMMKMIWDQMIWVGNKPSEEKYDLYIGATMKQRNLVDVDWALASFNMGHQHNGVSEGTGLIDKVTQPVLTFWGDKDVVVPQSMVELTAQAIGDNARMIVLENCGHSPITDALETMITVIKSFVEGE